MLRLLLILPLLLLLCLDVGAATAQPVTGPDQDLQLGAPDPAGAGADLNLGGNGLNDFLPVEKAFGLELVQVANDQLVLRLQAADGYYLYRGRLSISSQPAGALAQIKLPRGEQKQDPYFGRVEIYRGQQDVPITLTKAPSQGFDVVVRYQGCADRGLCYPVTSQRFAINGGQVQPIAAAAANGPHQQVKPFSWGRLTLFFLAGLGLAFTPCVLPMLPILSAVVLRGTPKPARALILSLAYVVPMALSFALLGALMGMFGASLNLQARLQSPWVLVPFAALFVVLALSSFDLYELRLPGWLRQPLERLANGAQGGSIGGSATLGVLSALLVSPCVSAPLAGALLYISGSGDAWGGALQLFALGMGMGAPLLLLVSGGAALLPRTGPWMLAVRRLFGVLLLAVALWMLQRILPASLGLWLWGALAAGCGLLLGALEFKPRSAPGKLQQLLGLALLVYGLCAWVGALKGEQDPWQPLGEGAIASRQDSNRSSWQRITSSAELNAQLADARRQGQPVVLDWYADWCTSCHDIERQVLQDPKLQPDLAGWRLLQVDVTRSNKDQIALLEHYGLFGPPAIVLVDAQGRSSAADRLVGEGKINGQQLATKLRALARAN